MSIADISEVMGHSPSTIARWLERDGQPSEQLHEQLFKELTLNLTIRHTVAPLRRRIWALAHRVRTLRWRVALAAAYYNFCRTHHALRIEVGQGRYRHRTPAMALGVTGHVWRVKEFITHPVYRGGEPGTGWERLDSQCVKTSAC